MSGEERGEEGTRALLSLFQKEIRSDPINSLVYISLAFCVLPFNRKPAETIFKYLDTIQWLHSSRIDISLSGLEG